MKRNLLDKYIVMLMAADNTYLSRMMTKL